MADYKDKIIEELQVMQKQSTQERNVFKARAYGKVINELKVLGRKITKYEDLQGVSGIGSSIEAKIKEILATGTLAAAEKIKNDKGSNIVTELMKIYGVGPVKANSLVKEYNIKSIDDLRKALDREETKDLLNDKQKIGLKYLEDIEERIPRTEMEQHAKVLTQTAHMINSRFIVDIVGSYRRGAETSGDIDVLLSLPADIADTDAQKQFAAVIEKLTRTNYLTDILAQGPKKCMGISKIKVDGKARRLDMLLTPPQEYAYALLYFTGSDKFNIQFRRKTLEKGYSLSEHGLKAVKEGVPKVPFLKDEKEVFDFFEIPYVPPNQR